MKPVTLAGALRLAAQQIPLFEARLLLGRLIERDAAWLIAHDDELLAVPMQLTFAQWVARRAQGEPVAYIVGEREFYGRPFRVTPQTLIPRPETELLVDRALAWLHGRSEATVLDLGTGSGCIAITLALESAARVTAVDRSATALAVARDNAERLSATVDFLDSDWYAALDDRRFDLIVANPPYIAVDDDHLRQGDLRFEPPGALVAGRDGLDDIREIIAGAERHLNDDGLLLIEHGYQQGAAVEVLLAEAGFQRRCRYDDLAGHGRVSGGQR